jgi:hypothetical protein
MCARAVRAAEIASVFRETHLSVSKVVRFRFRSKVSSSGHWRGRNARLRPPSGFVEFKTDVVYAVRENANGARVRLRQFQDQEHRARYAKGPERRGRFERAQAFFGVQR